MGEHKFRQPMQISPEVNAAPLVELHGGPADGQHVQSPTDHVVICVRKDRGDNALVSLPRRVPLDDGTVSDQVALSMRMGGYLGHYEYKSGRFTFVDERHANGMLQ